VTLPFSGIRQSITPVSFTTARAVAFGAVLLVLALAGCGEDPPTLPKLAPGDVVLAFGDSLTFGTGAKPEESYPAVLGRRIGVEVINAGVPGEVTANGLKRLPAVLERENPKLVILCHGGNDMLRKKGIGAAEQNLREMIGIIRQRGASVVMLGVPNFGLFLNTAEFYETVANDLEVPIDAEIIPDLLGDNEFKSDHIHPNAKGYARIAEAVENLLREHGAL
jgi:lysophospholipase L1-like esterase